MIAASKTPAVRWMVAASLALLPASLPLSLNFEARSGSAWVQGSVANAKGGGDDSSGSGSDGGGGDHGGNSGSGGGSDSGNSGSGGGDNGGSDDGGSSGRGGGGQGGRDADGSGAGTREGEGGRGSDRRTGPNGGDVGSRGNWIQVIYPGGWKEEVQDGRFELKDPKGRTVVKRRATAEDLARLRAVAR